jgi:hypothetical protein
VEGGPWRIVEADPNAVQSLLRYLEDSAPLVAAEAMLPEHVEQLRALGYLPPEPESDASREPEGDEDAAPVDPAAEVGGDRSVAGRAHALGAPRRRR